ncbi:MAG: YitT family protein [Candidatus Limivivens sp.]|nr:YitT family protein [Candidatus Limivivens sp.]
MKPKAFVKEYLIITLASLVVASAVFFFLIPSHLAVGSISGLAVVLSRLLPFPISAITFVLNVFLLIFGFITIGGDFGGKTVYTSLLLPVLLSIFENLFPENPSLTGDPFLDMLGYIFVVSVGLAILFNRNASSGGLDIIAKFLNKYFHMELGVSMALPGILVALSSAAVYDAKTVFLSVLGTYLAGIVLDHFILGFNVKKRVCIISDNYEQIMDYLLHSLNCGATLYEAVGGFDRRKKLEIITILNRSEYSQLLNHLYELDPNAFVTVYTVNEVIRKS